MKRNIIETIVGIFVIILAMYFVFFSYTKAETKIGIKDIYALNAKFNRIDGISQGSEIRIAGIKVGRVGNIELDQENYVAKAKILIDKKIKVPGDSSIEVLSDSLMGGKFLNIVPGSDEVCLAEGESFKYSQSSISIENLIGKYVFGGDKK